MLACWVTCFASIAYGSDLRVGIVGTDSSHAVEFTRILNGVEGKDHVPGARVVAAYRGGSPGFALSRERIAGFTATLAGEWKIPFVETIQDLCPRVDGLLLLSVDPATREREFKQAAGCGKPIFVDKPFAPTLQSASALALFASQHHVPWFSASALRYSEAQHLRANDVTGAEVWGPGALGEGQPLDLTWYGIHSIEMLYAVLGPGAQTVSRIHQADSDVITAVWADGRIGSIHLTRPDMAFGVAAFRPHAQVEVRNNIAIRYEPLVEQIVGFLRTGVSPVDPEEMIEVFAWMDAAQSSMQQGGTPVRIRRP